MAMGTGAMIIAMGMMFMGIAAHFMTSLFLNPEDNTA
jgi:hypothetical protein